MAFLIFDYSNTNVLHRTALLQAINNINAMGTEHEDITVVVSTRNMIRSLPHVIFGRMKTVINIVGFGRLYSDYGIFGRFIFNSIVRLHDRTTACAFIVEHDHDKEHIERIASKPVFTTHGSGLDTTGFSLKRKPYRKPIQIGYLSRFDNSKGSHQIVKVAQNLPVDRHLIIAGWDIKGDRYSKKFRSIAQSKENVTFLGRLYSRPEISQFFNSLDLFLSPSVREGGNISLQEAIWHGVPFLTTDAPGCLVLAKIFGCPAIKMEEFGDTVVKFPISGLKPSMDDWRKKIRPFTAGSVEHEYTSILKKILESVTHY